MGDNFWLEAAYAYSSLQNAPILGLATTIHNYMVRAKYNFALPWYSFLMPYVGYQYTNASSDQAGVDPDGEATQQELDQEVQWVSELGENRIAFGVSLMRRLAPGWFARLNIGTDSIDGGIFLEF